ncbi:MAG: hypothetical protein PHW65_00170 [Dehalococcoidales bacterium]|nr:hypothetical protein [Dehalococcoidales bacterium]
MSTHFDPDKHQYFINSRPVPSVTQVLHEVVPEAIHYADEWYLQRGTAVHACMALLAQGKRFSHDPEITGQVKSGIQWFADYAPDIVEVETHLYSELYQFAGTPDLICRSAKFGSKTLVIVDWKADILPVNYIQLGGYGVLYPAAKRGIIVALSASGRYSCSKVFEIEPFKREFLALISTYAIKQRLGIIKSKEGAE